MRMLNFVLATRSRPSTRTCRISRRSSSTTTSAGAPGREARRDPAGRATRAGTSRGRRSASSSVTPSAVQVAHGLDHRQRAARELALGAAHDAVLGLDPAPAEHELAVAHPGRRRGVGDEREARRAAAFQATITVSGGDVVQVDDHLHDHVLARERGKRDARVARRATAAWR